MTFTNYSIGAKCSENEYKMISRMMIHIISKKYFMSGIECSIRNTLIREWYNLDHLQYFFYDMNEPEAEGFKIYTKKEIITHLLDYAARL